MEEVSVLIARSQSGDKGAREVLIEKNLGLVHSIVRRFMGRGYDPEDLFQIGAIGLMKSIDKFDLKMGVKFSTYAVPMITGEIRRFLRDDGPVKISRTIKENAIKVKISRQKLQGKFGREPTMNEISEESGLEQEDVILAMEAVCEVESIYAAVYQDDGSEVYLVDRIAQGSGGMANVTSFGAYQDPEKEKLLNHILLKDLLEHLPERERELINMRYFQDKTQVEIASVMGISQVQVSRLEKRTLRRMREMAEGKEA